MPNSLVLLNIQESQLRLELRLPIQEFILALPNKPTTLGENDLVESRKELENYFAQHVQVQWGDGKKQSFQVKDLQIEKASNEWNGNYRELIVELVCPKNDPNINQITLHYDAIIHQVVTHFAIVKIAQDFNNGIVSSEPVDLGVIQLDLQSNSVKPLEITLEKGSIWKGFRKMFSIGMEHIRHGLDHLLYLLVLLLVAPLKREKKYTWGEYGGHSFAAKRILGLITAFTIGHSISLLISAITAIPSYNKTIEIGIGVSILLAAVHAIRPLFGRNEILLTVFFGLIHGAAFASSLFDLHLPMQNRVLSVLGFNLGIEAMQLIAVLFFLPLWMFSQNKQYFKIRISIASFSILASLAWITERITNHTNTLTEWLNAFMV